MSMAKATEQQLEAEVIATFREQLPFEWTDDLLKEVMATVRKAWIFGRDTGYREARDDISNGMYFN